MTDKQNAIDNACALERVRKENRTIYWGCGIVAVALVAMCFLGWLE